MIYTLEIKYVRNKSEFLFIGNLYEIDDDEGMRVVLKSGVAIGRDDTTLAEAKELAGIAIAESMHDKILDMAKAVIV